MRRIRPSKFLLLLCLICTCTLWSQRAFAQRSGEAVFAEAEALNGKGDQPSLRASLQRFQEARQLFQKEGKAAREADVLGELGSTYYVLGELDQALGSYQDMLSVARRLRDRKREAAAIRNVADVYSARQQYPQAISQYEQALAIANAGSDRKFLAETLYKLGVACQFGGDARKALEHYRRALAIYRGLKDRDGEADTLYILGAAHDALGDSEAAITNYKAALPIFREHHRGPELAGTLNNLGAAYRLLSRYEESIDHLTQAVSIYRETKNRSGEAAALNNLGSAYHCLADGAQAIAYWRQALAIYRELGEPPGQAIALNNLGSAYQATKQADKALEAYQQSLELVRAAKFRRGESKALANVGLVYADRGDYDKAIDHYQQALPIAREVKDRQAEGIILSNLGAAYFWLKNYDRSVSYYESALILLRESQDRRGEAGVLSNLMDAWSRNGYSRLAGLYGKRAVNVYQAIRADSAGLSRDLQRSYLQGNESTYRKLADLLIADGRLAEAQRTLNFLKDQEFFAFVRRDSGASGGASGRLELTAEESDWAKKIDDHVVEIGRRRGELLAKANRTPAEEDQLSKYEQMLMPGNAEFQRYLEELAELTKKKAANAERVRDLREAEGLMQDLRELPAGTVAIYTLAGEDKYRAILVTPDVPRAYEYPIAAADLNRKVLAFREAVETPHADPRALGKELFDILIGPKLSEDLRQAKAETLMWSLDGTLRYLPLAALHDGKQYLVERFRIEVFTPASNARLKDKPAREWRVAGFGVTKAHGEFQPLPEVADELKGVAKAIPGEVILDEQFTAASILTALRKRNPVMHIASHFSFQPGNETNSFLLLGDGGRLTLADLKAFPPAAGLDLLTLSACNTGLGGAGAEGKEVEGFGVLAQKKGAKAVLASLWEVSDESTSLLMQEFYRLRETTPAISKAEALRQAQLAMLRGQLKPVNAARRAGRGAKVSWKPEAGNTLPAFPETAGAPFAHPYYWGPFFLIGNWL